MNVVYPPTLDFSFMRQRPQQLMLRLAAHGHRVFFLNKTQRRGARNEEVAPDLWVVHDHDRFVRRVVPRIAPTLVWCSWAKLHDRLSVYRPSMVVYDCLDDFPAWRQYEDPMLRMANAVVTTSRALHDRLSGKHPRVALVPNGCDYEFFSTPAPPPPDLPEAPYRAGFVGALGPWVDGTLITRTAARLRSWHFVLIGPSFGGPRPAGPRIHSLGMRPYEELPGYLHSLDVGLIPFIDDQVTRATNPIKMWEYLASGIPVVSTPLPEVLRHRDVIRIGTGEGFARQVDLALGDSGLREERQARARENSWQARYEDIVRFIPRLG